MRSLREIPGNPWPNDMTIQVDSPNNILELLFIRHAWKLQVEVAIPAADPEPEPGRSFLPSSAAHEEWDSRWIVAWERAWEWYDIDGPSQETFTPELLGHLSRPGQDLDARYPPFWNVEYGDEGIDRDALSDWARMFRWPSARLDAHPEQRCLDELIPAWKAGLTTVIELPLRGLFAKRISPRVLVVSRSTRNEDASYRRALSATAPGLRD